MIYMMCNRYCIMNIIIKIYGPFSNMQIIIIINSVVLVRSVQTILVLVLISKSHNNSFGN